MRFNHEDLHYFYKSMKELSRDAMWVDLANDMDIILSIICEHEYDTAKDALYTFYQILDECLEIIDAQNTMFDPILNAWVASDKLLKVLGLDTDVDQSGPILSLATS